MAVNAEDLILAHSLKNERQAIPVNITAAVNDKRIDSEEFVDDGLKQLDDIMKRDCMNAKKAFNEANENEMKGKKDFARRKAILSGAKIKKTKRDEGKIPVFKLFLLYFFI